MPNKKDQKKLLLAIHEIMKTKTDETHGLSIKEIQKILADDNHTIDRRTVTQNFDLLNANGFKIIMVHKKGQFKYHHISSDLDLSEWKILVDAIQSSKFITEKKSNEIVSKISASLSQADAKELKRYVYVQDRNKSSNESVFLFIDEIHKAIRDNKQITFKYFDWDVNRQKAYHRNGEYYVVEPWSLIWEDENYYLVCSEPGNDQLRHFRVDKMENVEMTTNLRTNNSPNENLNEGLYSNSVFGMFSGTPCAVTLKVANRLSGVIVDRFGDTPLFRKADDDHFLTTVKVVPSPLFYGWALSFGSDLKIVFPENIVNEWKQQALDAIND